MNGALKLGTILGIRIQVHWSFVLIIGWVLLTSLAGGQNLVGAITSVAFVLVLFGCVVLHELGHALAARMYGIPTRDITLLPIGGVARLERMPRKPSQELVVALAGPAVNVIIAGVLLAVLLPFYGIEGLIAAATPTSGFLTQLLVVNVALVVFNLLPAFPMDGGRVLRALLAMFLNYTSATRIAATVGQICAFGFGLLGFVNPFMFLIAVFIFFGAAAEAQSVQMREGLDGVLVRDAMLRQFRAVPAYARIRDVAMNLLDSSQQDYPVVINGKPSGMLRRDDIIRSLSEGVDATVADLMRVETAVEENESLIDILDKVASGNVETIAVTSSGNLVGLLDTRQMFAVLRARQSMKAFQQHLPKQAEPDPEPSWC